jgi:hypothetical protein
MELFIFRVTVRGRFENLTDDLRQDLRAGLADHDALLAEFTDAGTLTYDARLQFFSFRYQVRAEADNVVDAEAGARVLATDRAWAYLDQRGLGYSELTVKATNMADAWRGRAKLRE